MIKELIYILILIAGVPAGLVLTKLCRDEIRNWRKRLWIISIICLILAFIILFLDFEYKIPAIITLIFILITSMVIIWRSHRHKL